MALVADNKNQPFTTYALADSKWYQARIRGFLGCEGDYPSNDYKTCTGGDYQIKLKPLKN
jgi:hypothetical protein